MRRIAILALAMLLLVALAVPAGAVGDSLPWTKYCQTNQTVKSHGYGYNWQTHTRGSTSWWGGNYSGLQSRSHTWWGYAWGSGDVYSDKTVNAYGSCVNIS